jgi:ubiquinone/menaquinone biosynthesis C-methylase UbiE
MESNRYYTEKLAAKRLKRCYEIAPPRIQQYLQSEIDHVLDKIKPGNSILELGCGYGRVIKQLVRKASIVYGMDTSIASLKLAKKHLRDLTNIRLIAMDAVCPGFKEKTFNMVICIQNGISAFKVDRKSLIKHAVNLTKPGGIVLFSSYSAKFWGARLEWFEIQAREGLLGEIDYEKTGDGKIECKDGFKAATVSPDEFSNLVSALNLKSTITEIDQSSLFCEIDV